MCVFPQVVHSIPFFFPRRSTQDRRCVRFCIWDGRTARRYFLSHSQRVMHRFVTLPLAPLSLGTQWDRISSMTVLHASFRDLAIALNLRFERRPFSVSERAAKVRCGMVLQINTFAKRQAINLRVHSTYEQTDCRAEHVA